MANELPFDRDFSGVPGRAEPVAAGIHRVLAPNPSPFTFTGTCTYLLGEGELAVVDPGPDSPEHIAAILEAAGNRTVRYIIATHTHQDHTSAVPALRQATGAEVLAEGPHRSSRRLHEGETRRTEAGGDFRFAPDRQLRDGEIISLPGITLEVVATPGHTANHLVFALKGTDYLLSGDHVMGWSTSIVAPPDGSMSDYMASLARLKSRPETTYLPGHGGPVRNAPAYVERLIGHRAAREAAILRRLERGESDIAAIVQAIYIGLDPRLAGAAALTTLAHLEDLVARGTVLSDGPPTLSGRYRLA